MALSQRAIKRRVDSLFAVHSAAAAVSGSLAVILPHLFEWIMVHHGEVLALRDNSPGQKIEVGHINSRRKGATERRRAIMPNDAAAACSCC